jgi:hypothetical protein
VLAAKAHASGELLAGLRDAYAAEPGAPAVNLLLCESQPQQLLHDGRADAAILPAAHPLAEQACLRLADVSSLPDLPLARWPGPGGVYPAAWERRCATWRNWHRLIALGRTTVVMPESIRAGLHEGPTAVPVVDAPAIATVFAYAAQPITGARRAGSRSRTEVGVARLSSIGKKCR